MRLGTAIALFTLPLCAAQPITVVSAASFSPAVAPDSLAAAFGTALATRTLSAPGPPWPTSLAGITVEVRDSANRTRPAGLLFVSPSQINFQVPAGTAPGAATLLINNGIPVPFQVQAVAPALFTVNAQGLAAASAVRMVIPTRIQSPVPVFQCVAAPRSCFAVPIDPGVDAPVFLSFYGTGIRLRSALDSVSVQLGGPLGGPLGGLTMPALFAGPQPDVPGLDQVNVLLPLGLRGRGAVTVIVTADGVASNPVQIAVQ